MSFHEVQQKLTVAAVDAQARIARDRVRASPRVAALLGYLGQHLFDPDLSVGRMKRACGIRDNGISTVFRREIGQSPRDYIAARRLETATRLLRETDHEIWQLAESLGYSSLQVFSRAFYNWCGERPTAYRSRARAPGTAVQEGVVVPPRPRREVGSRRSEATPAGPRPVGPCPAGPAPASLLAEEEIRELRAETIWQAIRRRPWSEQRKIVRETASPSFALFHLLRRKSREEGRDDRRHGVRLAELALDALAATGQRENDDAWLAAKARGWAWLGNARSIVLDFAGAQEAFATAERWLPPVERTPEEHAELRYLESCSRLFQGRLDEARELLARAFDVRVDRPRLLAQMLIQRASIHLEERDATRALPDLRAALATLEGHDEPYLELSATHALAAGHLDLGQHRRAEARLKTARGLAERLGNRSLGLFIKWQAGLLDHARGRLTKATRRLRAAHDGFVELGSPEQAAVVTIDLALVELDRARAADAVRLAATAVVALERMRLRRDALIALGVVSAASARGEITAALLCELRTALVDRPPSGAMIASGPRQTPRAAHREP